MAQEAAIWFQMTFLLLIAVLSHFLIIRIGQPLVIGEIIIGIIIGPSVVGTLFGIKLIDPAMISVFAQLGAIVLLFLIGLESDLRRIYTKRNAAIALGGVLVPWGAGYLIAAVMLPGATVAQGIFIGATLVATSVSVTASVLLELRMIDHDVGCAILGAAVVDDILGMIVLGIAGGFASGGIDAGHILYLIVAAVVFIVAAVFVGTRVFCRIITKAEEEGKARGIKHTGFMLAFALALSYAYIAEVIGISAIVGAFVAGAVFSSFPIRREFQQGTEYLSVILVPVFFISLGVLFDVSGLSTLLLFALVLTAVAALTKVVGCGIPARAFGMSRRESLAVGLGMVPRLEVALIIALYGLQKGIIGQNLYSVVVFMGVATALFTSTIFKWALKGVPRRRSGEKEEGCGELPTR